MTGLLQGPFCRDLLDEQRLLYGIENIKGLTSLLGEDDRINVLSARPSPKC